MSCREVSALLDCRPSVFFDIFRTRNNDCPKTVNVVMLVILLLPADMSGSPWCGDDKGGLVWEEQDYTSNVHFELWCLEYE